MPVISLGSFLFTKDTHEGKSFPLPLWASYTFPTSIWKGLALQELRIEAWSISVIPQPLHCAVHRDALLAQALLALSLPATQGYFFLRFWKQQPGRADGHRW